MRIGEHFRGLVFPRGRARRHPAGNLLLQYAKVGCPVSVGKNWTVKEMQAAVDKGPHTSALVADAIAQIQIEARDKERQGFATIVKWDVLKQNLPANLKISPLAMIPHKSRKYRAILDLSFSLTIAGWDLPSVNEATSETAPSEAIDQVGEVLPRIIEALATTPLSDDPILFSKLDIKDGFWRMACAAGEEWNFAYVLPNHPGEPIELVIPSALQMGWTLSPCFFHVASETARDVAQTFAQEAIGALPAHPLEAPTLSKFLGLENPEEWDTEKCRAFVTMMDDKPFFHMLEIYCDDFIALAQTSDPAKLLHLSRALLHGIHSVFPPPTASGHVGQDPVSEKKLMEGDGQWEVRKEVLGWMLDGGTRCIELARKKQEDIDHELHCIIRMSSGVPFKRVEKLIGKIRHAAIGVPTGKNLMTPINRILRHKPAVVYWKQFPHAKQAFRDWRTLLKEAAREPTTAKELVMGSPEFLGWVDASGEGVGGGWLPGKEALEPTMWRLEWPQEIRRRLITPTNPEGDLDINDLEMAGKLLAWLVLEGLVGVENLRFKHVGLFSDNMAAVSWTIRGASKRSDAAGRLLRVLALRQ